MSISFDLLVYTRSKSFDYRWIYGIEDVQLQKELQKLITEWLSNAKLANLPPVVTFFMIEGRYFLMTARASQTRKDSDGREIYERAILMWNPDESLKYIHLAVLFDELEGLAEQIYSEIPNNVLQYTKKKERFDIEYSDMDGKAQKLMKNVPAWELPRNLTWEEVIRKKLIIEVPNDLHFLSMISGVADRPISKSEPFFIGMGLSYKHCYFDIGWLISSSNARPGVVNVLDKKGNPVIAKDLVWTHRNYQVNKGDAGVRTNSAEPSPTATEVTNPKPPPQGQPAGLDKETKKSEQNGRKADELEIIDQAVLELSEELGMLGSDVEPKWFKKAIDFLKHQPNPPVFFLTNRITLLVHSGTPPLPLDIVMLWANLNTEIIHFYQDASPDVPDEWVRRIREFRVLVLKADIARSDRWYSQLKDASQALIKLLQKIK